MALIAQLVFALMNKTTTCKPYDAAYVDPNEFARDGILDLMRIGQEGNYLVLRPMNPLAGLKMTNCQFYQIGKPEVGGDDNGAYVRWPLNNATFQ